eukprot:CAMPEP_0185786046 /NCGR_PEP_ID=MMETSP1174-20130828/133144_1 /TAXON_ID=35687 /ORGANISM="Dictyocha speculum, Strain CCMP1381" /LENGTH=88 /DNA_ID=CAMNT_0028478449 /DNA_START=181 /DNA_END=443 /DNA_ORIENTATION=-
MAQNELLNRDVVVAHSDKTTTSAAAAPALPLAVPTLPSPALRQAADAFVVTFEAAEDGAIVKVALGDMRPVCEAKVGAHGLLHVAQRR